MMMMMFLLLLMVVLLFSPDLATTLRGWRPAVVRGFVTPESAEAKMSLLLWFQVSGPQGL